MTDSPDTEAIAARAEAASTLREGPLDTFMRHAHTDILALLAALATAEEENKRLAKERDDANDTADNLVAALVAAEQECDGLSIRLGEALAAAQ